MTTKRTLLLDGDVLAYRHASRSEEPFHWGDGLWTLHAWEEPTWSDLKRTIDYLMDTLEGTEFIVALSDDDHNWRKDVMPDYKADRVDVRKPLLLKQLKQRLLDEMQAYIRPTLEADDVLGILSTWEGIKGEKVIVSIDKDMKTIPGLLFRTNEEELGIQEITEFEADRYHMFQTLAGDKTDGYRGCPGVGPVKAERILNRCSTSEEFWPMVLAEFEMAGLTEADALQNARVARILRASDYDFKERKPILWTP